MWLRVNQMGPDDLWPVAHQRQEKEKKKKKKRHGNT